jgi:amino acid permease
MKVFFLLLSVLWVVLFDGFCTGAASTNSSGNPQKHKQQLQSVCQRVHQLHKSRSRLNLFAFVMVFASFQFVNLDSLHRVAGGQNRTLPADQRENQVFSCESASFLRTTGEGVPPGFAMLIEILCFTIALGSFPRSFSHPSVLKRKMRGNRTPQIKTF